METLLVSVVYRRFHFGFLGTKSAKTRQFLHL
jgi:hypothetical protein